MTQTSGASSAAHNAAIKIVENKPPENQADDNTEGE